jgi:hypothetical protein
VSHECFAYAKMLDREEVSDAATRLLLLIVAEHTRNKTGLCYEDRVQLAHDCRCSTKTVYRKLKALEAAKIVKLYPRYRPDGSRRSDEIEIVGFRAWLKHNDPRTPEPDPNDPESEQPDGADDGGVGVTGCHGHPPGQDVTTPRGQSVTHPGQQECRGGDNRSPLTRKGPSYPAEETHTQLPSEYEDGGGVRENSKRFGKAVEEIYPEKPELAYVIDAFLGPLFASTRRPSGVESFPEFLRAIRDAIGERDLTLPVLERARKLASAKRTVMPALPECLAICDQAQQLVDAERAAYEATRRAEQRRNANPANAAVAARTEALRERLQNRLGRELFTSWFAELDCERIEGQVLVVSVPIRFKKSWISSHYAIELRECATAEFEGVGQVNITVRDDGRRQGAAA